MSPRQHIPRVDIDRNRPARAYTHGIPWVSRAAWVAYAVLPGAEGFVSPASVKTVLWDLVYIDESKTTSEHVSARCGLSLCATKAALRALKAHGLITSRRTHDGTSYQVNYEAIAKLDRCRAAGDPQAKPSA